MSNAEQNPKLSGAAKLVLVDNTASRYEQMKDSNPTLATTTATEGDALATAVEQARTSVGGLPLDPEKATELAVRSGNLLKTDRHQQQHLQPPGRPADRLGGVGRRAAGGADAGRRRGGADRLVGGAAGALGQGRGAEATPAAVRVSLFNSLAESGKIYGNRLGAGGLDNLLKAAADRSNLDVQAAAAEAVGAMNLPADQARRLIIEDTKQAEAPTK